MSWDLDPALAVLPDLDVAIACEEHVARPLRDQCPDRAAWVATFALLYLPAPPQHVLLCDAHAHEWRQHMAGCATCQQMASLVVEPLDRKAERR